VISTRKVKKMNKKLLTIAIALVIFVIVASPVSAIPTKSPLPTANPWNIVWGLFQDLQKQITNIQLMPGPQGPAGATGATGAQGPVGTDGATVHFGPAQEINVQEGGRPVNITLPPQLMEL
jgi:hypothetical protein